MSALSIRKLPKDIEEAINRKAKLTGHTKTEVVIEILSKEFGLDDKKARKEMLQKIFKKKSPEEIKELTDALSLFGKIDKDMWT